MANLLSELERFEQEMKELVSDSPPSSSQANSNTSAVLNAKILTAAPISNEITVQSITPAQQSSRSPAALAASVLTSSYLPGRPSPIISSNAQSQPQISTPLASTAPHMQWLGNGAGPALAPSAPVPSVSASSSSQFTYSSGAYPPGPSNVPSVSATATSGSPYFPLPFHLQHQPEHLQQQQSEQQYSQQQQYVMAQYQLQVEKYTLAPQLQQPPSIQAAQYQYSSLYQAPAAVGGIYSLPQQQQLFQKDAQTITPEALESVKAALASSENEHKAETKRKQFHGKLHRPNMGRSNTCKLARKVFLFESQVIKFHFTFSHPASMECFYDLYLYPDDFCLFCGDLGNEVNDEVLTKAFSRFANFNMARLMIQRISNDQF